MFFSRKCHNCGMLVARRALECQHCEEVLREVPESSTLVAKTHTERVAIGCVACSCLAFVLSLGLTDMYRSGGLIWGLISLVFVFASINWARKLERERS